MKTKTVAADSLIPYIRNPRKNSAAVDKVAASIKEYGWQQPIVVDKENVIIAGHTRLLAAQKLGMDKVPVHVADLSDAQAKAYRLADNRISEDADWDIDLLGLELRELDDLGFDLDLTGFDNTELANLLIDPDLGETDEDAVPEPPEEPISKPGDLWILGEHRLLCGDSTNLEDVERLMDGEQADICFTSPPYALGKSVALRGNTVMSTKQRVYDKHDDNSDEWLPLMDGWWDASVHVVSHAWLVNVQPLAGNKRDIIKWINARSNRLIDIITWDKGHAAPAMAAGVLASRYEWIIGMGKTDASRAFPLSSWRGTLQSVYEAPPQHNNEYANIHAATMPVHLPSWIMGMLCDRAQSVYEPFCGTGTTLIAAEQLNRKCYGMEISPQYCDVIVKRWEQYTSEQATLQQREAA